MSVAGSFLIKLQQGSPAERQVLKKYLRKKFLNTFELQKKKMSESLCNTYLVATEESK